MSVVHLHLLLNHVPVVGILAVLLVLVVALRRGNDAIAKLGLFMLAGVGLITVVVYFTGEPAEEAVEHLAGVSESLIHSHEEAAGAAFMGSSLAGVAAIGFLLWSWRRSLPRWTLGVSLAMTLAVTGLMAWTANLGGQIRHSEIRGAANLATEAAEDSH